MERISEFTQTDFPEPVEPAISKCGVFERSMTCASPWMSFPNMTGTAIFLYSGNSCSMISRKATTARSLLGTSIPTARFPGIGATMRTDFAAKRKAILSCSVTILLSFTPGAGKISNIVTTGPFRMPVTSALILNSSSVSLSWAALALVPSSMTQ